MGSNLRILTRRLQDPDWYERMRAGRLRSLREKANDSSKELPKHRIWIAVIAPPAGSIPDREKAPWSYRWETKSIEIPGRWNRGSRLSWGDGFLPRTRSTDIWVMADPVDTTIHVVRFAQHKRNKINVAGDHQRAFEDSGAIEYIRLHRNPSLVRNQGFIGDSLPWYGPNRHNLMVALAPTSIGSTCWVFPLPMFDCCGDARCNGSQYDKLINCCSCQGICEEPRQDS